VEELHSEPLEALLGKLASKRGFKPAKAVVEISGLCADCG
jgi:Fe2+ or Zn2+ uptake regulation protein